jgi:hypothetical protein
MTRRVLVLALSLATMASPLALTMCQVLCAEHASTHAGHAASAQHSCHVAAAPASTTMTAVPHACGHTSESPTGLEQWVQTLAAPVAVLPVASWSAPLVQPTGLVHRSAIDPSPPGSFLLTSQLRV